MVLDLVRSEFSQIFLAWRLGRYAFDGLIVFQSFFYDQNRLQVNAETIEKWN